MADENDDLEKAKTDMESEIQDAMESIFDRPITPQEFYFLLSRYPYLQICDVEHPYIDEGVVPKVTTSPSGWEIHNYGTVVRSGSYELLAYLTQARLREGGEGEGDIGGHGTIVRQYTDVAFMMIQIAIENGWSGAEILSGFYPMQRMAWIAAREAGYSLKGFLASDEDRVVEDWVRRIRKGDLYPPKKPIIPSPSA